MERICVTPDCGQLQPRKSQRGLCNKCYSRMRRGQSLTEQRPVRLTSTRRKPKPVRDPSLPDGRSLRRKYVSEAEVRALLAQNLSTAEIAENVGLHVRTLQTRCRAWGIGLRHRSRMWTAEMDAALTEMWNSDWTAKEIGNDLGVDVLSVGPRARRLGLGDKPRFRIPPVEERLNGADFEDIAGRIVKPGIEKHLVPLLHFRGSADLGRVHRLWNFTLAIKEHEVETMHDAVKIANHPRFAHLCEPIKGSPFRHLGMFFNRLMLKPLVCSLEPGLLDYVRGLAPFSFELTPVDEIAHHYGHAWWRTFKPREKTKEQIKLKEYKPRATELMWPYIKHDPKKTDVGGTDIVDLVNSLVSKSIPEENRADICQDLILAVLEGKYSVDDIRDNPRKHISAVRDKSPWKYEWVSLDQPMYGDEGYTLAETLAG